MSPVGCVVTNCVHVARLDSNVVDIVRENSMTEVDEKQYLVILDFIECNPKYLVKLIKKITVVSDKF